MMVTDIRAAITAAAEGRNHYEQDKDHTDEDVDLYRGLIPCEKPRWEMPREDSPMRTWTSDQQCSHPSEVVRATQRFELCRLLFSNTVTLLSNWICDLT